ncbi:MAG: hypothetical protein Q3979_09575 [Actinomycetaceae bacterium]|nr:hypothetical protein [Actinomycetaceae bacterium]
MPDILFLVTGFAIIFALFEIDSWTDRRRVNRLETWAKSQGFNFVHYDEPLGRELRDVLELSGQDHRAVDIVAMPSRNGLCLYGNLKWEESGSDNNSSTCSCTFVRFDLPGSLPFFLAKPEGAMSRKYNDINTEWDEFNREWEIRSENRAFALALLTPVMQEFIMANMRGMELRTHGGYAYGKMSSYTIEESVAYHALMDDWYQRVPPFLWQGASFG